MNLPKICLILACSGALLHAATDITFFVISDTHYGSKGIAKDTARARMPDLLHNLPGTLYPNSIGGGVVDEPRGVLIAGDLVDNIVPQDWEEYASVYGVNGEKKLRYPTYEATGNHDFYTTALESDTLYMMKRMVQRNMARKPCLTNIDSSGYHYSWDWDDVHFVNMNVLAGSGDVNYLGFRPLKSLDFLAKDLSTHVGSSGRPVIIMQHFPLRDDIDFPAPLRAQLSGILRNYNVVGIVHGHSHEERVYKWIHAGDTIDVFDDGTVMNGDMMVIQITEGRLRANARTNNRWSDAEKLDKPISMGTPRASSQTPCRLPAPQMAQVYSPPKLLQRDSTKLRERDSLVVAAKNRTYDRMFRTFQFTISGTGWNQSVSSRVRSLEILSLTGKSVRVLPVRSARVSWNRFDDKGRPVGRGIYLLRDRETGTLLSKIVLP